MEPLVTIVMTSNYKTLGDWDQKEIDWLLLNMDWRIVSRRKGYIVVQFFIPVTK